MNPNIYIHNKHTPLPYTPAPPPPSAPPPPPPLLPPQDYASQLPTTTMTPSTTTSTPLTSVRSTATSTHATARIQPSAEFLKTIYDVDNSDVNGWLNNEQQNVKDVKEWMNNEQQNVKDFRDDPKDTGTIRKHTIEPMEIEHTFPTSKNRNKLRGNMNEMKKVMKHNPTNLTYSEPLKSMLSHPTTPNIIPHAFKLHNI